MSVPSIKRLAPALYMCSYVGAFGYGRTPRTAYAAMLFDLAPGWFPDLGTALKATDKSAQDSRYYIGQ